MAANIVINNVKHYPVMFREILHLYNMVYGSHTANHDRGQMEYLTSSTRPFYIADGTFGGGNHAKLLMDKYRNIKV